MIESLKERGLKLYLASGTDQEYMRDEARLLDVDRYFDGGVYGALDDYKSFSKKILIQRLIASAAGVALSASRSAASLCGMVTFAPR